MGKWELGFWSGTNAGKKWEKEETNVLENLGFRVCWRRNESARETDEEEEEKIVPLERWRREENLKREKTNRDNFCCRWKEMLCNQGFSRKGYTHVLECTCSSSELERCMEALVCALMFSVKMGIQFSSWFWPMKIWIRNLFEVTIYKWVYT